MNSLPLAERTSIHFVSYAILIVFLFTNCKKDNRYKRDCSDVFIPTLLPIKIVEDTDSQHWFFSAESGDSLQEFIKFEVGAKAGWFDNVIEFYEPKYSLAFLEKYNELKGVYDPLFKDLCKNEFISDTIFFVQKSQLTKEFSAILQEKNSNDRGSEQQIRGRILNNGIPEKGAQIELLNYDSPLTYSREHGVFTFNLQDLGQKELNIQITIGACTETFYQEINFSNNKDVFQLDDIRMKCSSAPRMKEIKGQLRYRNRQDGVPGQKILSENQDSTLTDEAGFFRMSISPGKRTMITLTYPTSNGIDKTESVEVTQKNIVFYYD